MSNSLTHPQFKLSFCIPTFNRAAFIGTMLEELISQISDECEIVISDNASTDNTEQVVSSYSRRFDQLRYFRNDTNLGVDRNFDRVMTLAKGEFCWLMADDDMLKPGAVTRVLSILHSDLSLVIVNMELRDLSLSKIMRSRWIKIKSDRLYESTEMDRLFVEMDYTLWNSGNLILRHSIWISRNRAQYYDSQFIHTGVIFQEPLPGRTLVISTPLINYRLGNNERWFTIAPEIFLHKWPSLVDTLALSNAAKKQARSAKPWRQWGMLLFLRSRGYSLSEYRDWIRPRVSSRYEKLAPILIALLPRKIAYVLGKIVSLIRYQRERLLIMAGRTRITLPRWARRESEIRAK